MFVVERPAKEADLPTLSLFVNEDLPIVWSTRRPNELPLSYVHGQVRRVAQPLPINASFNLFLAPQNISGSEVFIHCLLTLHSTNN